MSLSAENALLKKLLAALCLVTIFLSGSIIYLATSISGTNSLTNFDKAVELAVTQDNDKPKLKNYSSPILGYEFSFNPAIWREDGTTHLDEDADLSSLDLTLRKAYGYANVHFLVLGLGGSEVFDTLKKERETFKDPKLDNLDLYALRYVRQKESNYKKDPSTNAKVIGKERVKIGSRDFYKITLSESHFEKFDSKEESTYYEYLTLGEATKVSGDEVKGKLEEVEGQPKVKKVEGGEDFEVIHAYLFETRYSDISGEKALTEDLIGSFKFSPPQVKGPYFQLDGEIPDVKGATTDKESGVDKLTEVQLVEMVKPAVVNILSLYCYNIKINTSELLFSKSNYRFCSGMFGSGFFITKDGHIATNGHVVKSYPEEAIAQNILTDSPELKSFAMDLIKEIIYENSGQEVSDREAELEYQDLAEKPNNLKLVFSVIIGLMDKKYITVDEDETKYFVKIGSEAFDLSPEAAFLDGDINKAVKVTDNILEATLVDFDFPNQFSLEAAMGTHKPDGSDVGVLKIKDTKGMVFPILKLGSTKDVKEGSSLVVVGYPGLVSGEEDGLIDYQSSAAKPTVTRGITSAIKTDQSGRRLLQTDASIDHGNSGGPAFNEKGEVIGIATYGFTSNSGNFNFLRDVDDLKQIMNENNLRGGESETSDNWRLGLENFWKEYYKKSVPYFEKVQKDYPVHPSVTEFLDDAKEAIEKGDDKTPVISNGNPIVWMMVASGVGIFMVLVIVILFVVFKKKKVATPPPALAQAGYAPAVPR